MPPAESRPGDECGSGRLVLRRAAGRIVEYSSDGRNRAQRSKSMRASIGAGSCATWWSWLVSVRTCVSALTDLFPHPILLDWVDGTDSGSFPLR